MSFECYPKFIYHLKGRTIPRTIGAQLYTDIKDNPNSLFTKIKQSRHDFI